MTPALMLALALAQSPQQPPAAPASAPAVETGAQPTAPEATATAPETAGAESHAAAAPQAEGHSPAAPGVHAEGEAEGHATDPASVLMHHVTDQPYFGLPSKHLVFFVLVAVFTIVVIRMAVGRYDAKRVPQGFGAFVEMLVVFIRDDIAEANIGHDGRKFTPLLCSFFFFILFAALIGLVPVPSYANGEWSFAGVTSTGNIAVTLALATISFLAQQYAGISKYGVVHHFMNLVPPGLPKLLLPIMIPVEFISMFTKPFALMVRLFANMLAGHMVITALLLLIPLMAQISTVFGIAVLPVSWGLTLFIMLLEILVAFIQAYIFTLLSAIFIGMYAHPAH
jgi:F-type H+-transporting ATPase subunit a